MECKNCGRALASTENYCSNCGTPQPIATPVQPSSTANNSNQNVLIGIIVLLALGLIGAAIAVLARPNPVPTINVTTPPQSNPPASALSATPAASQTPSEKKEESKTKDEIKTEESTPRPNRIRLSKADDNLDISRIKSQIEERYSKMNEAYNALDEQGLHAYHARNWRYHDTDGTVDTLNDSVKYFRHIFDPNNPKRITYAKITSTIQDIVPLADDMVQVRLRLKVDRTNAVGQSLTISVLQDDIWDIATLQCIRTNVISKSKD
jgi:hypothetical protein